MNETTPTALPATRYPLPAAHRWVLGLGLTVMALTLLPYLIGASLSAGRQYMWLGYNLDDSCVYLSWMRQAADGSTRAFNLFTTEPQKGMPLNPLFLVLGRFAGITGLPMLAVYHGARILFGVAFIGILWRLACQTIADTHARKYGLLLLCFSAGFGWLPLPWQMLPTSPTCPPAPIDMWQPEAITFLSLYLSPLFVFSLALQAGILSLLLEAERQSRARYAIFAGLGGFLLGLVHSYDVISVSAVWFVYLLISTFRPLPGAPPSLASRRLGYALLAGALTAPSVAYIYIQYRTEEVFRARADVATLSAPLYWVVLGYGLTLILACVAVRILISRQRRHSDSEESASAASPVWTTGVDATRLLIVWAIMNIAVAYLPGIAFQRKLLQGTHIPIALLAGIGMASLLQNRVPIALRRSVLVIPITLFLLALSNIRFVVRDITNYTINRSQTMQQRPYLERGELEALNWLKANTPPEAAIQPLPWVLVMDVDGRTRSGVYDSSLACFAPGLIHRKVYCGHWGETPDFGSKLNTMSRFTHPMTDDTERQAILRSMKVDYLLFSQLRVADEMDNKSAEKAAPMFRGLTELPDYLEKVYSNEDAAVYRVLTSKLSP